MRAKLSRVSRILREVLSPEALNDLGRETGQSVRLRVVTPSRLMMALIGAFAGGTCDSIADVLREFNLQQKTSTRYKAFYNRLARPGFPAFVHAIVCRALGALAMRTLEPRPESPLAAFTDAVIHDGSSFAVKDGLASVFPGRFRKNGLAAVELHATFSGFQDEVVSVTLAPDKEPERPFLPNSAELQGKLFLADRGYCGSDYFHEIHYDGGNFIIRVTKSFDLWVIAKWRGKQRHLLRCPGRLSKLIGKRYSGGPLDLEVRFALEDISFRMVVLPGKEAHGTRLATNLSSARFPLLVVAQLYRLRWQVELIFKEWKSYANLRAFDTANPHIAEGLIWASVLASILKRFLAHAAQAIHFVEISTRRAAMCLPPCLRQLAVVLERGRGLGEVIAGILAYLAVNASRADPHRDQVSGRRATGLRPAYALKISPMSGAYVEAFRGRAGGKAARNARPE